MRRGRVGFPTYDNLKINDKSYGRPGGNLPAQTFSSFSDACRTGRAARSPIARALKKCLPATPDRVNSRTGCAFVGLQGSIANGGPSTKQKTKKGGLASIQQ